MSGDVRVFRDHDAVWWTERQHEAWTDATPFTDWEDALDHGLWLSWCANRATPARPAAPTDEGQTEGSQ